MNELNSVILEGTLADDPQRVDTLMVVIRLRHRCERYAPPNFYVEAAVRGKLGTFCIEKLHEGDEVRVVGRLMPDPNDDGLMLEAEHVMCLRVGQGSQP